ncbi:hypothetical protein [Burkholderia sp. GbtcB21]|uniref:hypothetical protein n=1 Tax=Burkholderia sp. GbtcB21 TaxID=2824766 RepID=UPI001C30A738|nr:hypothetical protein [Burkholderia sp. GbtcB21]
MNESKSTPGPWSYDRGILPPDGPGRYSTVSADGDVVIAEVNDLISEGIPNARLITAAPDMAEVLEMIAADADAGEILMTSGIRLAIDAALIKAGRKAAPVREGE